jgi:hypothetical protein
MPEWFFIKMSGDREREREREILFVPKSVFFYLPTVTVDKYVCTLFVNKKSFLSFEDFFANGCTFVLYSCVPIKTTEVMTNKMSFRFIPNQQHSIVKKYNKICMALAVSG